ncbi:HU family DNA-binding protein [Bacillus anthracis]|uniref:HU family DNA-binding protein n=1 Tax=Bacillus anthracis TaxID=1392 RepID=UPI00132C193E|nr:HU family DNA-binding protein [Bacillus anthracis]MDR4430541.1 DNA-binding protein [Bacillus anthracis]MXR59578.1 DNA-binding protein [Bacillus anthracis]
MNKTELIKNVAQNAEISQKEATVVVQTVVESITNTLAAGEEMQIAASKVPAFKAGKELKEAVK